MAEQRKRKEKEFEADVKKLKEKANSLNLARKTKHWWFGNDPQRARGNLGVRKSLHRSCSRLIRQHISRWIPTDTPLQFCTSSNANPSDGNCCYDLVQFQWTKPLNLIGLITQMFGVDAVSDERKQWKVTKGLARYLIDERTSNCKLQIVVNDTNIHEWYMKRVKQDRVSKSMDIAQNGYRMSYAPRILVEVGDGVLMEWSCPGHFIGFGFWDLVHWRTDADAESKHDPLVSQPLHAMLHICEDLEVMKQVSIAFGTSAHSRALDSIKINAINPKAFGSLTLYEMNNRQVNEDITDNWRLSSAMFMPLIGDLSSPNNTNNNSNSNTNSNPSTNCNTYGTHKRKHSTDNNNDLPPLKRNHEQ